MLTANKYKEIAGKLPPCEGIRADGTRCRQPATTVDHFTPRCIASVYGWSTEQTNAPENLQFMCTECHQIKDSDTRYRRDVLVMQVKGGRTIKLGQHNKAMQDIWEREQQEKEERMQAAIRQEEPAVSRRRLQAVG